MYFCSFFLVFFLFAQKLYATEVCISSTPCKCVLNGGQVIDLTSVGLIQRPRFSEILHNGTEHFYSYNPCYPFDSPDKYTTVKDGNKPCTYAAGCVKSPGSSSGNAPEEHAVGMQDTFKFDFINGIAYINYSVPGAKQTLSVKLECDNSTESHNLNIDDPETDVNSHVVMTLKSKCACVNGCGSSGEPDISSGLSTGSKLIIAFFTITLAYFIIGMVYNFCNGAQGVELVPNLDFWNELPKLIIMTNNENLRTIEKDVEVLQVGVDVNNLSYSKESVLSTYPEDTNTQTQSFAKRQNTIDRNENFQTIRELKRLHKSINYDPPTPISLENQFDLFGKSVAAQLKGLPMQIAVIIQAEIQEVLKDHTLAHIRNIPEGVAFSVSCCGKKSSYGEVS